MPVIVVAVAAPAMAASGAVTATFSAVRESTRVREAGAVTNGGTQAASVTITVTCDLTGTGTETITGGSITNNGGWTQTAFGYSAGAGTTRRSARWIGNATAALAGGATLVTPTIYFNLSAATASGTAALVLSSSATVLQPVPVAFGPFLGPRGTSRAPSTDGFAQ